MSWGPRVSFRWDMAGTPPQGDVLKASEADIKEQRLIFWWFTQHSHSTLVSVCTVPCRDLFPSNMLYPSLVLFNILVFTWSSLGVGTVMVSFLRVWSGFQLTTFVKSKHFYSSSAINKWNSKIILCVCGFSYSCHCGTEKTIMVRQHNRWRWTEQKLPREAAVCITVGLLHSITLLYNQSLTGLWKKSHKDRLETHSHSAFVSKLHINPFTFGPLHHN